MSRCLATAILLFALPTVCLAEEPLRITRDHADEFWPLWNPAGGTICFTTNREPGRALAIGLVNEDGGTERLAATGLQDGFGVCGSSRLTWVGSTGCIVTGEASSFHEYLEFKVGDQLLKRTVLDGSDELFKLLLRVDGGGGSGFLTVSRDGSTALWRHSSIGGVGDVTLRCAPYAILAGSDSSSSGRVIATAKQIEGRAIELGDAALAPDGSFCVVSMQSEAGIDLFLIDLTTASRSFDPVQLTDSGKLRGNRNLHPSVSPDGQWVAFDSTEIYGTTQGAKIVAAKPDLYLLRIADRQLFALTASVGLSEFTPSWAPNGKRIVFGRVDTREAGTVDPGEPNNQNIYTISVPEKIFRTSLKQTDK